MNDLFVIHPGAQHGIYGKLGESLTALEPPTVARMVAGYERDRGYATDLLDTEALGLSPSAVAEIIEAYDPRLVAIVVSGHQPSASTQQMTAAGDIARAIKEREPGRRIIMCGNHPSALPDRTLREEAVDYVADGEAVRTIEELLNDERLLDIPGLVHWSEQTIDPYKVSRIPIVNPPAPLIVDLDHDLHGDAWDLLPMERYRAHNWHAFGGLPRQPYASVYTSLGCPYKCSFCMINTFQHENRYRMFSPAHVVGQVKRLHDDYGVRNLKIADEMFCLNRTHVAEICEGLAALDLDLNIWAYSRVDTVMPDLLGLMRRAGIRWLALGIESGSAHVRDGAGKRLRAGDIVDVVRTIQSAGINVIGNFMFGLRDDTADTMRATLDLALACLPEFANFYCTMAYPGSALYDQALREGWTLPGDWRSFSQHNSDCRPLDTEHVGAATVLRFRDAAFRAYFSAPAYRDLVRRRFGAGAEGEVERMLSYRLKRKLLGTA